MYNVANKKVDIFVNLAGSISSHTSSSSQGIHTNHLAHTLHPSLLNHLRPLLSFKVTY